MFNTPIVFALIFCNTLFMYAMDRVDYSNMRYPLHEAVSRDDGVGITILLSSNAYDVNAYDEYGKTPLFYACMNHKINNMAKLLNAGADPNGQNDKVNLLLRHIILGYEEPIWDGGTLLMYLAALADIEGVELLLAYGADPLAKTKGGKTVLDVIQHMCTQYQESPFHLERFDATVQLCVNAAQKHTSIDLSAILPLLLVGIRK